MSEQWLQRVRHWSLRSYLSPRVAPFDLRPAIPDGQTVVREDWKEIARFVLLVSFFFWMLIGVFLSGWVLVAILTGPFFGRGELIMLALCAICCVPGYLLVSWSRAVRGLSREIAFDRDSATTIWRWHGEETARVRVPLSQIPPLQIREIPASGKSRQMFALILHVGDRPFCLLCRKSREKLTTELGELPPWLAALGCEDGPRLPGCVHQRPW